MRASQQKIRERPAEINKKRKLNLKQLLAAPLCSFQITQADFFFQKYFFFFKLHEWKILVATNGGNVHITST